MGFLNSIFCLIFLSINSFYQFVAAENKLNPGAELNSLNTTSNLVSASGEFTLGFFNVPLHNFTYLGIWYTNDPNYLKRKVWVANRDTPILDYGVLTIDDSGTLKLTDGNGSIFFNVSNHQVGSGNNTNTIAVLQDSGNFLVYDSIENRDLWQSLDYPTDTIVPGMKIGYNLTTKQNWTLDSWLSDQIPATGSFTMRLEQYQNSPQLLIYGHGEIYWASGPWEKDNGTFQLLDLLVSSHVAFPYNLSLISDPSGMHFFVVGSASLSLQLNPKGQLFGGEGNLILTPEFCYGYQSDNGCAVSALPSCRSQTDSFAWKSGDWNGGSHNYYNWSISLNDCMEICWKDCNCLGFRTLASNGTGCMTWSGDETFRVDESGQADQKYVLVSRKPHKKKTWIWILVSLVIVLTSALTCCLWYMRIRMRRIKAEEKRKKDDYIHQLTGGSDSFNYGDEIERGIQNAPDVKIFTLGAILTATNNFSNENKLGQGGYGPVYKGKLLDGREIAVKKLSKTSGQGIEEFRSELILISKLQHTNLVRLYGCCIHQEEKMLIYEFMPNKSLDFFLFAEDKKEKLDWQIRFNIIDGVAQGLLYLHKYSRMKVIHRDLKVSNVLLDKNMNPKIADFGMARIFKQDMTEDVTNRVVGTYGYMAPEYALEGTISVKTDVFSFGVLMLEIVSGKRNSSFYNPDRPLNLVGYAWELWKGHASLELKDETLGEFFDVKQLLRAIHIGLICVQENADDRPDISDVIYILKNETVDLPIPKQPAFFTGRQTVGFRLPEARSTDYLLGIPNHVSENGLTVTAMEAR